MIRANNTVRPRKMSIATFLLVAVVALHCGGALQPSAAGSAAPADLKSLCANKNVDLTRISQIKSFAGELEIGASTGAECAERTRSALKELNEMISAINGNVCSLEAVERIRAYYETYVSSTLESGNKNEKPLPKALRNFVLAFGLRVSQLCKKNMINSLTIDSETLLKDEDHRLIAPWTNEQSLISQLMSEPSDYDDLLLPRDLNRVMEDADQEQGANNASDNKLYMQTATGQVIRKMQAICGRRFRPIYEQLIMPLIYLSNMGFNYQGEELERELKEMSLNKEIHQWYRIVYLCEPLQDIEIVEDPKDAELTAGTDQRLVRILTHEEAAKIKAEFEASPQGEAEELALAGIEQIVYKQEYATQIEDLVVDSSDAGLMKLVNKFATHKSELERIRSKLIKKLAKFMMNKLKHGQFNIIGSLMGGKTKKANDGHEVHSANNEIVKALDEYVEHAKSGSEGSVSGFGVGGVAKRYYHKASTDGISGLGGTAAKKALSKTAINQYFWYFIATALFVVGISALLFG